VSIAPMRRQLGGRRAGITCFSASTVPIVCAVLFLAIPACSVRKVTRIDAASVQRPQADKIVGITTIKGEDVSFDAPASFNDTTLRASVGKTSYELPLDQIQRYWVEKKEISKGRTIALVATVAAVGIVAAVAATRGGGQSPQPAPTPPPKTSCPFIYSWDGTQFVLDAEPYGAAITRGLERDDYSELKHLRANNGSYRLLVRNEADETQFTNLMALQVVDHETNTQVIADGSGGYHIVKGPQPPISARDHTGRDILRWLEAQDRLIWEPDAVADTSGSIRDEITMTFRKPKDGKTVKLVTNVATGRWGAFMIKESLLAHGRDLNAWYQLIDTSPKDREALLAWNRREELYELKVYVKEATGWEPRGIIPGGGPEVAQSRVVLLDASHAQGDALQIQVRPPAGFWALNYFAVDPSPDEQPRVETLRPVKAEDETGKSVLPSISALDDSYYTMPVPGNRANVEFPAPASRPGMERTVFLHSRGYYQLHLNPSGEPNNAVLQLSQNVPDAAARLAAIRYSQWRNDNVARTH
jgi:hypothetical protein